MKGRHGHFPAGVWEVRRSLLIHLIIDIPMKDSDSSGPREGDEFAQNETECKQDYGHLPVPKKKFDSESD